MAPPPGPARPLRWGLRWRPTGLSRRRGTCGSGGRSGLARLWPGGRSPSGLTRASCTCWRDADQDLVIPTGHHRDGPPFCQRRPPSRATPLPAGDGTAIEVDRLVNGRGLASVAGHQLSVGYQLAGQITSRMEGTQMATTGQAGTLLRTMACPVPPDQRPTLRGSRRASPISPQTAGPVTVQRRVSSPGQHHGRHPEKSTSA